MLFIDARKQATTVSRVQSKFTDEVIDRIAGTVVAWRGDLRPLPLGEGGGEGSPAPYQDIPGFCRSVPLAEIAQHGHVLTPGRYVGRKKSKTTTKTSPPRCSNSPKSWASRWPRAQNLTS